MTSAKAFPARPREYRMEPLVVGLDGVEVASAGIMVGESEREIGEEVEGES